MENFFEISQKISGVTANINEVKSGFAFVAIKGVNFDSHHHIDEAFKRGARYVIYQNGNLDYYDNCIKTENSRSALSLIASAFYKNQPQNIIAVTGTNGKTSCVSFYEQILSLCGYKSGSIGTLGASGFESESCLTTPDPITLHKLLSEASKQNVEFLGIEASSHGLKQKRLDGVKIKAAGFTSFSQDHLDYHENLQDYFNSKMILFTDVLKKGYAVINADIPEYKAIKDICIQKGHKIISYGKNGDAIKLLSLNIDNYAQKFSYVIDNQIFDAKVNLIGEFQVYNILCAIGFAYACSVDINLIATKIPLLKNVSGRMERANIKNKEVYIDYAHTPDALKKALLSLRPYVKNRLIVIFGCGGNRDHEKRSIMGGIAEKYADYIIVTDDNPRFEKAEDIRASIICELSLEKVIEIEGRENAIAHAIHSMMEGDILLIAGKGHENYQIINGNKLEFNDKEVAESIF